MAGPSPLPTGARAVAPARLRPSLSALLIVAGLAALWALAPLLTMLLAWCPFRLATGLPCPLCGLTRSLAALARGELGWAFSNYPALGAAAGLGLAWAAAWAMEARGLRALAPARAWLARRWPVLLAALLVANWAYRLALGMS